MLEKVAVVGMGYVGLPLALAMTDAGKKVIGIDTNGSRVAELAAGKSFTADIASSELRNAIDHGLSFSTDYAAIATCSAVLICVPTPLGIDTAAPDLQHVLEAVRRVARLVSNTALVVIESTVAPGTTQGCILDEFIAAGKILDEDFLLAFSPERVNPGSGGIRLEEIPKLTSGVSDASAEKCDLFYSSFVDTTVRVRGTREAEFAKLLENSYRLVNIALANELAIAAFRMGIDYREVVNAASSKPYGFEAFYPSAGAGGHCIPVDPVYLNSQIELETGTGSRVLELAIANNGAMPREIISIVRSLSANLTGKQVLVAGVSYKPGVSDVRNSAGVKLIEELQAEGAHVSFFDPLVEEIVVGSTNLKSASVKHYAQHFEIVIVLHSLEDSLVNTVLVPGGRVLNVWNRIEAN